MTNAQKAGLLRLSKLAVTPQGKEALIAYVELMIHSADNMTVPTVTTSQSVGVAEWARRWFK